MITILCTGSRGDFQPYIALAQELLKRRHSVRICGGAEFQTFVEGYGIDYFPIHTGLNQADIDQKMLEAAATSDNPLKVLLTFNKMKEYGIYMVKGYADACRGSDLILYHPGAAIGYFAAKHMGIPAVLAAPFPMHKTKEQLSILLYGKTKKTTFHIAASYSLLQGVLWMASKSSIKQYWKQTYHQLPEEFGSPFEKVTSENPAIISCSNHVFPRPKDWSPHIHQHGYWFAQDDSYTPPAKLAKFISQGEKPIYLGFGSMGNYHSQTEMLDIVVEAVKETGKRAIISGTGFTSPLPDTIMAVESIPHSWLFNQVSAVCHHGGAGTTAAGFRAGVPSVIIPFSNDQFAWAHRAYDLGVGSYPIYQKKFTKDALVQALRQSQGSEMINNARHLGNLIQQENGTEKCIDVVESLLPGSLQHES